MDEDIDEVVSYFLDESRYTKEEIEAFINRILGVEK